jgi:hypothetical protein
VTSPRRPGTLNGVGAWLLAVLAAVGLLVFGAGTASAHTLPDAGNRVRVSAPETITAVGVSEHIAAGQGRGPPVLAAGFVVATGVAAEDGGAGACAGGKCGIPGETCFVAGTKIRTEHGLVDIEDIKIGDKVWSRNLATGKDELQPVVETYVRHADSLLNLTIAGAVLTTTKDHPFWVQGKGWTKAGDLHAGDTLLTPGGTTQLVAITPVANGATVYNVQVAVNHDYYALAGRTPVLVHNANYSLSRPLSPNQMNQAIQRGAAPPGIVRVDIGKVTGEQTHAVFGRGQGAPSLNMDGTWKHGYVDLTKDQITWLRSNGWSIP